MATELTGVRIEPGPEPSHKKNPKLTRSLGMKIISIEAFLDLLRRIGKRPLRFFRVAEAEAVVYHRLMDELEDEKDEESSSRWWWAQVVLFLGLVAALVVTASVDGMGEKRWPKHVGLRLWQWVALVMVLFSGLSFVRFATFMVFTPVMWRWRIHRYVVYMVEGIKWCVDLTLWFALVLVAWYLWFRPRLRDVRGDVSRVATRQITRLLIALVLGSFLWTLKNVLYLKLKADLHYDQLYDRIRQTVIDFHGIQIIYHKGMWKFLTSRKNRLKRASPHTNEKTQEGEECRGSRQEEHEAKEGDKKRTLGINIWIDVCEMNKRTVPIWVIRRLAIAYLRQMSKVGLPRNRDATGDDQKLMSEAQQMLREIIGSHDGRSDILPEDLDNYELEKKELHYLFRLFETLEEKGTNIPSQSKLITRDQFLSWAVVAYKNCWGLERTLYSSERVFIKLNRIMSTFLAVVMLIVWLLLSEIVDTGQLALLFAPFAAASFIFGDSCKKMFEGLIFTFAMHPFDVGDRVVIDNVQMKVTRLNILTSLFFKYDTGEEVVYPNSLLASTKITNLDIAPDQADSLEFIIPSTTPIEDITDLELKIKKAVDDDITYAPHTKVAKKEVSKEDIRMVVYFKYLVSYLGAETKAMHRSRILTKIMEFSKDMAPSNVGNASSVVEVERVEFILDAKVTIDQIVELKRNMLGGHESMEHSKVLMKSLDKKHVEMVVCLRKQKPEVDPEKSKEELEKLKLNIFSVIKSFGGRLKDHEGWSARRIDEVWSLGRTSETGASDVIDRMLHAS